MTLPQQRLLARVTELCRADGRLDAALTYGSFPQGRGDAHSDIEFWLFAREPVDPGAWIASVAPPLGVLRNEFGAHVAVFEGLLRGEFHFSTAERILEIAEWPARGAEVDAMVLLDRRGALRAALTALPLDAPLPSPEEQLAMAERFANWLLLAQHTAARGELLRAADALGHAQLYLTWLVRFAENRTQHWLTPSRRAEHDLPPAVVDGLTAATAPAESAALRRALAAAWRLARPAWRTLAGRYEAPVPEALFAALDAAFA
jgi:lincosamide nucleotidyltransferase